MFAVAGDQVGNVVADHATEPAALLAGVVAVVAHIGGAATQIVTADGSRPASAAASRTALIIHSVRKGSAS